MKKRFLSIGLMAFFTAILSLSVIIWAYEYIDYSVTKTPSDSQFDFPGNYTPPELTIDGLANEEEWENTPILTEYNNVTVKMYRGDEALFFFFDVLDNVLLTRGNANDDTVTRSDSIELYLDTLNNGGRTPQSDDYQFNFGIHGKTRIMQGSGSNWGNWNGLIDYEVHLNGTLNDGVTPNDTGYSIEVMVPYRQINIQKESTIGISFGRVNKTGLGDTVVTDWNWFGWNWGGMLREPQTIDNYVSVTADGTLFDRDELPVQPATIIGTVTNELTGSPIAGATVTYQEDDAMTTTTNDAGYYVFTNVDPELTYVFDVTHDEYFPSTVTYTRDELRAADGGAVDKSFTLIERATAEMTSITGQVKNLVNGFVDGATVSIAGTTMTTTTSSEGFFEIEDIPASSGVRVLISKAGHATEEIILEKEEVAMNGVTELGIQNLSLAYNSEMSFGGARGQNSFVIHATRSLTGLRFLLTTNSRFEGPEGAILYLQGGVTGTDRAVGLRFGGNGNITFDKPNNSIWHRDNTDSIDYYIVHNSDPETGASLFIEIPFAYMFMTGKELDPFGLSAGSNTYEGGNLGWDGMGSPWGFVSPDDFTVWARYNHLNNVYQGSNNIVQVTISGTALQGTLVSIGAVNATANSQGNYSIVINKPTTNVTLTARLNGYVWYSTEITPADFVGAFTKQLNIDLEPRFDTLTGTVVDTSDVGIADVLITITDINGEVATTTTDEFGEWTVENVPTIRALQVVASKEGLISSFANVSLAVLNGETDLIEVADIMLSQGTLNIIGQVSNYLGALADVSIEVVGAGSTTSAVDGTFTLEDIGLGNLIINISKTNYVSRTITYSVEDLTVDMTLDLDVVDLGFRYAELGSFATGGAYSGFNGQVTRGINGFEFVFTSVRVFNALDRIELYVSTKTPGAVKDAGTYLFSLNGDGTISITDFDQDVEATLNQAVPTDMQLVITRVGNIATVRFILPYDFFEVKGPEFAVTADEVIGIALAQYSAGAGDIGTWSYNKSGQSAASNNTVNRDNPSDYVRLAYDNILYNAVSNATVDFDAYDFQFGIGWNGSTNFGTASDRFFGNVSRDEEGIIFDFVGLSNQFSNDEMILIYLDLDGTATGGWEVDYLYKIRGNGILYGRAGAWWNALSDPNNVVSETDYDLTIDNSDGFIRVTLKLFYTTLGVAEDATIGFAFREALQGNISHSDHTLYDPWHDFYYQAEVLDVPYSRWFNHVISDATGIDAANEAQFVRIDADGVIFRAGSNSA